MIANPYFWITLIGLLIKMWATHKLYNASTAKPGIIYFGLFLLALYIQTFFELANYFLLNSPNNQAINIVMDGYYIATFATVALLPLAMISLVRHVSGISVLVSAVLFLVLSYALLGTNHMILGYSPLKYAFTRVSGEYYYAFQVCAILSLLISLTALYVESRNAVNRISKIKADNLLLGFLPLAIFIGAFMILMRIGYEINIAGILPILMSVFLIALSKNINNKNIVDFRIYLPWTKEAKFIRKISEPFCGFNYTEEAYKDNVKLYEQMLLKQAQGMFQTNREIAKWIGMSESNISRKLKNINK